MASFSTGMTSLRNMSSCINARSQGCIRSIRYLHTTQTTPANPLPITQQGPPPKPPIPLAPQYEEKVLRRKRQAELLKQGKALRAAEQKPGNAARRRFWKDVHVVEVPGKTAEKRSRGQIAMITNHSKTCRRIANPSGYSADSNSFKERSNNPSLKTTSCSCNCPGMGPSYICSAGIKTTLDTVDLSCFESSKLAGRRATDTGQIPKGYCGYSHAISRYRYHAVLGPRNFFDESCSTWTRAPDTNY